jgi:hypothetical protein
MSDDHSWRFERRRRDGLSKRYAWAMTLVVLVAVVRPLGAATADPIRLRLVDAPTKAPLAGAEVRVDLYLHNPTCAGSACYSDTIALTADADGVVTVPAQSVSQPRYEMLRISAAKYVDRDVVRKLFSAPAPVTVDMLREAPHLEDLRLRLVDASTHEPLSGVAAHVEVNYHQVSCLIGNCHRYPAELDVHAGPDGVVALPITSATRLTTDYASLTVAVEGYKQVTLADKAVAVPQPVSVELRRVPTRSPP